MLPLIFHSQGCHLIPCCNQLSHGPCIRVLQRISLPMVEMQEIQLVPGMGRSPGEGNDSTLQYSCPENPMVGCGPGCRRLGHNWRGGFILKKGSCKEEQQIQNLQDRSACWKPWKVLLLQLKSKGSLEADSPAPRGTLDFFLWRPSVYRMRPTHIMEWTLLCMYACFVAQSCPTLCDPMNCGPPGSSAHGILQARVLEWVAMPSSRGSSWPRDQTLISYVSCIVRWVLYFSKIIATVYWVLIALYYLLCYLLSVNSHSMSLRKVLWPLILQKVETIYLTEAKESRKQIFTAQATVLAARWWDFSAPHQPCLDKW